MKKLIKYFSIAAAVFLVTALIVGLFYIRFVYTSFMHDNESKLPPSFTRLIEKLSLREPEPVAEVKPEENITILEGWTSSDIAHYFERRKSWSNDEFLGTVGEADSRAGNAEFAKKDWVAEFPFLADKPVSQGLEGYLFPDTYRIYASSTMVEVVEKMLANFDNKLTDKMRADIKKQGKSLHSIMTMASIIEKEAPMDYAKGDNRDARIISGIFWNRIKIGQGLQSDATLSYIFGDNKPAHSGQELEVDSPYNTYKYRGLTPGPICNPGILAIEAAIYPISTDYYYFLTADDGEVIYARNYDDHLKNKYQYLR